MFLVINMAFSDVMLGAVALSFYVCLFVGRPYQLWTNEAHLSLNIFRHIFEAIFGLLSLIHAGPNYPSNRSLFSLFFVWLFWHNIKCIKLFVTKLGKLTEDMGQITLTSKLTADI